MSDNDRKNVTFGDHSVSTKACRISNTVMYAVIYMRIGYCKLKLKLNF